MAYNRPYNAIPNVEERTTGASRRGQVFGLLMLAFVINGLSKAGSVKNESETKVFFKSLATNNLPAWAFLWVVLTLASDFDSTTDLALAFAVLIFLASLILNGEKTFKYIQQRIDTKPAAKGA